MAKTKTPTPTQESATPEDESQEALDNLFDELSERRDAGIAVSDTPPEKPDEESAEAAPAPAATPSPAPIEAAPEAPKDVAETPAAAAPAPAPAPPTIDRNKLSPELRAYFDSMQAEKEKLENERRSAVGRAAALDRQLASVKRRQEAVKPTPAPAPAATDDQFATEYPELSKALEKALEARVTKTEQQFGEALRVTTQKTKSDVLDGVFPGWLKTVQTPEFNYWLTQQDEPTQKLFDSDSVRDYAILLQSFKTASTAPPPAPPPAGESEVERIQKQRAARLDRSADVPSKSGAPNPTGEPDESDPEALFNWHSRKRDKERERQQNR